MEVTIRPKNFKLSADIEGHIRKRVERIPRHLDNIELSEVVLSQQPTHLTPQRFQYRAQITLRTRNNLIRSEVTNPELLTAIDQAIEHLSRQIERFKGRHYRRHKGSPGVGRSSAERISATPPPSSPEAPSVIEMAAPAQPTDGKSKPSPKSVPRAVPAPPQEEETTGIVKVKRFQVQPMFPEEAIEQMELLGHNFFVFWNAHDERMNVLYRRNDGDYGLLQPELS